MTTFEHQESLGHGRGGESPADPACRYIMVGGFLGAGKTTSVSRLARYLSDRGLRVGLITNDQGNQLVDTAFLSGQGFAVEEIAGGCFCCRFDSLTEAAQKLSLQEKPDVFIAEPVGSCTDLVATVTYPLRRLYGDRFTLAPLSVVVDPVRARRIFGLEAGGRFSDKVAYIYRKQLEEADLIVINKCDLLDEAALEALEQVLREMYPSARTMRVSARSGEGLEGWFESLMVEQSSWRRTMEVDYGVYGEGEALLGWLNATVRLTAATEIDGNQLLRRVAQLVQGRLGEARAEVAHLKMTLDSSSGLGDLAVINLVRNDYVPELSQVMESPLDRGQLMINLRAEADPETLNLAVRDALAQLVVEDSFRGVNLQVEHLEHFRPGQPTPVHRDKVG
jgi:G3E family GTPase